MRLRIPKLTNADVIRAFFGAHAHPYSYTVTEDEFNDYDNEGPGDYDGVEVPADLAALWDKGLAECKTNGLLPRSAKGFALRLRVMGRADADTLGADLAAGIEAAKRAPAITAWHKATDGKEIIEAIHAPGVFLVLSGSPERQTYIRAVAARAVLHCGWLWVRPEAHDPEFIAILRAWWNKTAPGWTSDVNDRTKPTSDENLIALHAHSAVANHLGEGCVVTRPEGA